VNRAGRIVRRKLEKLEKRSKLLKGVKGERLGLVAMGRVLLGTVVDVASLLEDGGGGSGNGKGKEKERADDGAEGQRLWEVVRALWDLRVREVVTGFGEEGGEERKLDMNPDAESEAEGGRKTMRRASDKPSLMELASLVYLGLLLLRYPIDLKTFFG
jgi:hypothetical protein